MKTPEIFGMILLVSLSLVIASCTSSNFMNQRPDEDIKTQVMFRYDQFAISGGKACDE